MEAMHVASGQMYRAADIAIDDPKKTDEWRCGVIGCGVPLHHKRAFLRTHARGGERSQVSATFYCARGTEHDLQFDHGRNIHPRVGSLAGDSSRSHIHRLTGQPSTPVERMPAPQVPSGATRTQYEYGESIEKTAGLVDFAQRCADDPELVISERFRHDGTTYTWEDLAYDEGAGRFRTLAARIRAQFNPGRAYFVQGQAKYRVYPTSSGDRIQLHLVNGFDEQADVIHVFMPDTEEFRAKVDDIRRSSRIAIFSQKSSILRDLGGVALDLINSDQICILD